MQVTGVQVTFALARTDLNESKHSSSIVFARDGISCVASRFDGVERPSGMVSKRKEGKPRRESDPRDLIKEALVVKFGVDESDIEAFRMKDFGKL
uniref:Uncharacterized protein n=1 Tax=Tanacetum cinerariifolium TaxID=118510 RepID=A0A699ILS0_TANCI|nr:hypothetical protein [Tanacetum cinerariifolium]